MALLQLGTKPATRSWAEIDLAAVKHNVQALRRHFAPAELMAVVKANGYGLGAVEVGRAAIEAGAAGLVVSSCEEGQELRENGLRCPILVLGYVPTELAELAAQAELTIMISSAELAWALSQAAVRYGRNLNVHLMLDTGLHRCGLEPERILEIAKLIKTLPALYLQGLATHFASSDEPDHSFAHEQERRYEQACTLLEANNIFFSQYHLANSAGGITLPSARASFVRTGLSIYGYYPSSSVENTAHYAGLHLKPAFSLKSQIARLSTIEAGETVGYNQTYEATKTGRLALVPIGYADGYRRALSGKGYVLIAGQKAPIVGRISMDQFTVDVSHIKGNLHEGDEVVLIGSQENASISLETIADLCDTISYEIITGLGRRIKRVYLDR